VPGSGGSPRHLTGTRYGADVDPGRGFLAWMLVVDVVVTLALLPVFWKLIRKGWL
jgi:hypothetical protein